MNNAGLAIYGSFTGVPPERERDLVLTQEVVRAALRAYDRGRTVDVVGPLYSFLTFAGRFAPRAMLRRTMGRAMRPAGA